MEEGFLGLSALLASHAAGDENDRFAPAEKRRDATLQIVQGVAVLGEEDELLTR